MVKSRMGECHNAAVEPAPSSLPRSLQNHLIDGRDQPDQHLAILVDADGFAARKPIDAAVVGPDGISGELLGGLIDHDLTHRAPGTVTVHSEVTDQAAAAAGQVCGGRAEVLLAPLNQLPPLFFEALERREPIALVLTRNRPQLDALAVTAEGRSDGRIAETDTAAVVSTAVDVVTRGITATRCVELDGLELAIVAVVPTPALHIVGDGPMADAIAQQFRFMEWGVTIDHDVTTTRNYLEHAGSADGIVVTSHDRSIDVPVLAAALQSRIGYIGAMGSRNTQAARAEALAELGVTDLRRINGPVGLDFGARTPPEVAVSIAAEVLALRSGRDGAQLGKVITPIH